MSDAIFPLVFANDEVRLLTAIVLGFLFGFSLERGGFGNARKLAAQFYLYDMTVFKVMFTAILVAMVGLYTLAGIGWVNLSMLWINPTFMWAQLVGGFILGVGFIMSGLCPGTSVVSAASGRWDAVVTIAGIFIGTFAFTLAVDWFPALDALYHSGSMGVSVLPELFGLPTLPFVLIVVLAAGAAFIGAEAVERKFSRAHEEVALTPRPVRAMKFGLAATLGLVLVVGLGLRPAPAGPPGDRPITLAPMAPMALAERIIAQDPNLMVVDLRSDAEARVPGAYSAAPDSSALPVLAGSSEAMDVVLLTADGGLERVPASWPERQYRVLEGGWAGWDREVLTPATPESGTVEELARVRKQNGVSAFFSGAGTQAPVVAAPPPVIPSGGGAAAPKRGGC